MIKKRVLFYSSVKDIELFQIQRFYSVDIALLVNLGYEVSITNHIGKFCLFWKYDIAFLYFYKWALLPAILAKIFSKKVYFTGGIDQLEESITSKIEFFSQAILFKLCYIFSDICLVVSQSDLKNIKKIYNRKCLDKVYFSSHTINVDSFYVENVLSKKNDFTTIAWMGSIENVQRKGVDKSLILFEKLVQRQEFSDSKFYIIGKQGEGSRYLSKLCTSLNITDRVVFTGDIDEEVKIAILRDSKYYFQLSTFEGFGIAAIEALAAKNIVIHSGKGGLKETIKNFGVKINIYADSVEDFVNISNLIVSYRPDLLSKAHNHILANYSNDARQNDFMKIMLSK